MGHIHPPELIEMSCGFEGCVRHFERPSYTLCPGHLVFCSNECRASQRFLSYAREVLPLKADHANHREIGEAMGGFSKGVAARRWLRFRTALPRYHGLAAICAQINKELSDARRLH